MSRGRTGNKIWQLITFSWHTLLWIVNGTSDLIGQLDSREPIILLWSTHVTTRSTSEIIQNLEEQHVIAKGTQMTKRIMVGGGGGGGKRRTEQVCCVSSDISWFYLCTNRIYLITQSIEKVMLVNGTEFWNTGLFYSFLFVSVIWLRSQHALGIFYRGLWKRLNKIANSNWK